MQKKQVKNKESEKPNEAEITKMQFNIGETIYSVPICWQAVTFSKYLDWVNEWVMCFPSEAEMLSGTHESADIEYPIRMLSFQTDVPIEVLKQCSLDGLEQLKETQMFWFDFEALNGFNYAPKLPNIDEAPVKFMIEFVHGERVRHPDKTLYPTDDSVADKIFTKTITKNLDELRHLQQVP